MPTESPGPSRAELAQEVLLHRMMDYSEDNYCASWLGGLEFLLWEPDEGPDALNPEVRREAVREYRILAEHNDPDIP